MKYNKLKFLVIFGVISVLLPSYVYSHGWGGYEQGAKAHGMGNAFTGLADDPTAVFYNPAGIVQADGTRLSVGFAVPTISGDYRSNGTSGNPGVNPGDKAGLETQSFFEPNLYLTSKINDRLSIGVGEYTIFGLGFKWPDSFEGRYSPGGKNGKLETMTLNPVAAYRVTDKLSVATGARIERADITLENFVFLAPGVDDVRSEISGDDFGLGWNAALLYRFSNRHCRK